jgi:soluble lytic murein transglycosylase-like protein
MGKVYLFLVFLSVTAAFIFSKVTIAENNIPQQAAQVVTVAAEPEVLSLGDFTTGDPVIDRYIVESSARYNIDPLLILAQMKQESMFKQKATSHKGASGLMQLMPATARRFGVTNIYEPQQNIDAGVKYMRWLLNKFDGDLNLALAGYNAGEGAVMKFGNQIPPYRETQGYVAKITAHYAQLKTPQIVRGILSDKAIQQVARSL